MCVARPAIEMGRQVSPSDDKSGALMELGLGRLGTISCGVEAHAW